MRKFLTGTMALAAMVCMGAGEAKAGGCDPVALARTARLQAQQLCQAVNAYIGSPQLHAEVAQLESYACQIERGLLSQCDPCQLSRLAEQAECATDRFRNCLDRFSRQLPRPVFRQIDNLARCLSRTFDDLEDTLDDYRYPGVCRKPGFGGPIVPAPIYSVPGRPALPQPGFGGHHDDVRVLPAPPALPGNDVGFGRGRFDDRFDRGFDRDFDRGVGRGGFDRDYDRLRFAADRQRTTSLRLGNFRLNISR